MVKLRLLYNTLVLFILACSIINAEIYIAMYGNPGSGKSTLLSCLTNTPGNFPSGLSKVTGLTKEFIEKKYGDVVYIDTPGLADIYDKDKAANQIEESLKKNENYKLIFVAQPTAGRINPDDLATMNLIIKSIPEYIQFGIIYNKLSKRTYQDYTNDPNLLGELHKTHLKRQPHSYLLLEKLDELDDQDNAITTNEKFMTDLKNFITQLPVSHIPKKEVEQITTNEYEDQLKVIQENYKREEEKRQKEIARLVQQELYLNSCIRYETQSEERTTDFERMSPITISELQRRKMMPASEIIYESGYKYDTYTRTNCIKGSGAIQYGEWIYVSSREVITDQYQSPFPKSHW